MRKPTDADIEDAQIRSAQLSDAEHRNTLVDAP
jgi:hypothetical protein